MEKPFERVLIVMFENQYRNYVMQTPFMQKLATAGADMMNYFGAFHPSQTNYIASLAGEVCATTVDIPPANPLKQRTLVDLMEEQGISWKAYMEAYPGQDWNPAWTNPDYDPTLEPITEAPAAPLMPRYFRKHNAFASFYSTQQSQARWEKIVSDAVFWQDVNANTLPQYAWFTPDIWNDGHYLYNTSIDTNPRTQSISQRYVQVARTPCWAATAAAPSPATTSPKALGRQAPPDSRQPGLSLPLHWRLKSSWYSTQPAAFNLPSSSPMARHLSFPP